MKQSDIAHCPQSWRSFNLISDYKLVLQNSEMSHKCLVNI